jgi:hypothetical protein
MPNKKLIYIGHNDGLNNSTQIYNAFSLLYKNCELINLNKYYKNYYEWTVFHKILYRIKFFIHFKFKLILNIYRKQPDVIIVNQLFCFNILELLFFRLLTKKCKILFITLDSLYQLKRFSPFFKKKISMFNFVIHTKFQDIELYKSWNIKNILFNQGFRHPKFKFENNIDKEFDVVFIGNYMPKRAKMLNVLINDYRFKNTRILIAGRDWKNKLKSINPKHQIANPIFGDIYYQTLSKSKVILSFFNEIANDITTTRINELLIVPSIILTESNSLMMDYFKNKDQLFQNIDEFLNNLLKLLNLDINLYFDYLKNQELLSSLINNLCWDEEIKNLVKNLEEYEEYISN